MIFFDHYQEIIVHVSVQYDVTAMHLFFKHLVYDDLNVPITSYLQYFVFLQQSVVLSHCSLCLVLHRLEISLCSIQFCNNKYDQVQNIAKQSA